MKTILLAALLALVILASGCDEQDVIYDMARFDRAFVPALALTGSKDTTGQSVLAVKRLKQDWDVLSAKYSQVFLIDGAADSITGKLDRADMLITTGDFQGAHRELESIREVLLRARKRHGIDYFMDHLTVFHSSMEKTVSLVEGREKTGLSGKDVREISGLLPLIRAQWNTVTKADFDRKAFLFDKQTEVALRSAVADETKAIDNLEAALKSGNRNLIVKHVVIMKQGYAKIFRMFGNFESVSI